VTPNKPASHQAELFIGLMSGTSLDGVDAVLAQFAGPQLQVRGHVHQPFAAGLRGQLLALNSRGRPDELHEAALAANQLAQVYAQAVQALLQQTGLAGTAVRALGAHGQTVRHRPGEFDGLGYTLQLFNGALLAELTGIDVVCDFRSRDVAAGGQGAPLVPAFHAAVFGHPQEPRAVLNIGGIANLTLLPASGDAPAASTASAAGSEACASPAPEVRGFDCGPGNALMDLWCLAHRGQPYDAAGAWAAQGQVLPALLAAFLAEPFLLRQPPKSTGRDLFHADWLAQHLQAQAPDAAPVDVQATLCELTARAASDALTAHLPQARTLLLCGGGALNTHLVGRLQHLLPHCRIGSTAEEGLPPMQVEAAAFAWLARACVAGAPGNLPAVTGAAGLRPLGALYRA